MPIQHGLHASTHHQSNATGMTVDTGLVRPAEAVSQKMTQATHDIPQTVSGDIPQQQSGAAQDAEMACQDKTNDTLSRKENADFTEPREGHPKKDEEHIHVNPEPPRHKTQPKN